MTLLARLAAEAGAPAAICDRILIANTAHHVLEICKEASVTDPTAMICQKVVEYAERHAGGSLHIKAFLIDFNGTPLDHYPPAAGAMIEGQQP